MNTQIAIFGGGCFWCTETLFLQVKGIVSVTSGYAGGTLKNPSYDDLHEQETGHAEVVRIEFDPSMISYKKLLEIFFYIHNPTTLNRQGADVGSEYRSIILYTNEEQKKEAEAMKKRLEESGIRPITTEIKELDTFYEAESYHQKFFEKNQNSMYCNLVIIPKMEHFKTQFGNLLKN